MNTFSNQQIDPRSLPDAEAIEYQGVLPVYYKGLVASTLLSWGGIAIMSTIASLLLDWPWVAILISVGLCLVLAIGNFILLGAAYRYRGYAIREHDIHIRQGIIRGVQATIPYKRIQQVSITQGLIARRLGYHNLAIWTSSTDAGEMYIKGLERTEAERIKAYILAQIRSDEQA